MTSFDSLHHNFDREGPGVADVYILCLEEFSSVGMLPPEGSSMFRMLPPGTFITSGLRNSADFRVHVAEDKNGWTGSSLFIATKCDYSFWVPKHTAKYYDVCENPWARYDVYITKHLPHQSAYAAVCGIADCYGEHEDDSIRPF
jgi:hypothetical protein